MYYILSCFGPPPPTRKIIENTPLGNDVIIIAETIMSSYETKCMNLYKRSKR